MFKAIFFDLDETLVNAVACHAEANEKVFSFFNINYEEIKKKTVNDDFVGRRLKDILQTMRDSVGITEDKLPLDRLTEKREEIFLELFKQKAKLLPGAYDAVKFAKEHNTIVAITSSGTRKYIHLASDTFNLTQYIDFIVGAEDVKRGKPFPDIYEKAFQEAKNIKDIEKDSCLVVEDSTNGVLAANAAGIKVCFVPFFPPKKELHTDYKLKSLEDFKTIF